MSDKCSGCSSGEQGGGGPFRLAERIDYSPGAIVSATLADTEVGTLTLFALDAGQRLSTHSAPYDAIVQVFEGEGEFTVAEQTYTLGAGEMLIMPAGIPHAVRAAERFKMILTMFRAGA